MIISIAISFPAAVILAVVSVSSAAQQRAMMRKSLSVLDGYQIQGSVREQEMSEGLGERVFAPLGAGAVKFARRFTPAGYVGQLARKTVLAGNPPGFEVDRLLVLKVLGLASGIAWVPLVYMLLGMHGMLALLMVGVLWAGSFLGP